MNTIALTDWLLLARDISDPARFVVGLALEHPDHAPSKTQLRVSLPINDPQIASARREIAEKRLAYVDRPRERTAGTQRFNRAVRLKNFAREVDHRLPGARYIILPTALTTRVRGRSGLQACRLLALYSREQMRRGAIQMPDSVAAWLLGWPLTSAKRLRHRLLRVGVLQEHAKATSHAPAVYVIPDAHSTAPARPDRFSPERTRYLTRMEIGNTSTVVYASAAERALLESRAAQAHPGLLSDVLSPAPIRAAEAIDTLGGRIGTTSGTNRNHVTDEWETETTPPLTPHLVSEEGSERPPPASPGDEDQRRTTSRKRQYGPEWANVFYFADDPTHESIESFVQILVGRYGFEDARGFLRSACLELNGRGSAILAWLRQRFPDQDPAASEGNGAPALDDDLLWESTLRVADV